LGAHLRLLLSELKSPVDRTEFSAIRNEARQVLSAQRALNLATVDARGMPRSSYAPYYRPETGDFYILVSTLTPHTMNLERGDAGILIIEDEQACSQIYARVRLQFQCSSHEIAGETGEFRRSVNGLRGRHGAIIDTLLDLSDFRMFRLTPYSGRFVKGFGQAYRLNKLLTEIQPVTGPGDLD